MKQTTNGLYLYEAADSPDLIQGYNRSMELIDPVLKQGGGKTKWMMGEVNSNSAGSSTANYPHALSLESGTYRNVTSNKGAYKFYSWGTSWKTFDTLEEPTDIDLSEFKIFYDGNNNADAYTTMLWAPSNVVRILITVHHSGTNNSFGIVAKSFKEINYGSFNSKLEHGLIQYPILGGNTVEITNIANEAFVFNVYLTNTSYDSLGKYCFVEYEPE